MVLKALGTSVRPEAITAKGNSRNRGNQARRNRKWGASLTESYQEPTRSWQDAKIKQQISFFSSIFFSIKFPQESVVLSIIQCSCVWVPQNRKRQGILTLSCEDRSHRIHSKKAVSMPVLSSLFSVYPAWDLSPQDGAAYTQGGSSQSINLLTLDNPAQAW